MDSRKRILHIGALNSCGGVETFQINLLRAINKEEFIFDVLVNNKKCKLVYEEEIKSYGGKVFYVPSRTQGILKRIRFFRNILRNNDYVAIHVHVGTFSDSLFIKEALKTKVKNIILHSHTTNCDSLIGRYLHYFNRLQFVNTNLIRLACSKEAGNWLHCNSLKNNPFLIIKNGIIVRQYKFSNFSRIRIRNELGIARNELVIGHVARFSPEKNYAFIIRLFELLHQENKKIKLVLIGDGKLKKEVENKVAELGLGENVIFTGIRTDIPIILNALDVFILPSIYEGLPFTLIEAQANGLKCFVSENITDEACLTKSVTKLPINESGLHHWASLIESVTPEYTRDDNIQTIKQNGFDIEDTAKKIEKIYLGEEIC